MGCGSQQWAWFVRLRVKSPGASKPTLSVTVATPQTTSLAQKINANGSLAAWQEAVIGAEANGLKITVIHVQRGTGAVPNLRDHLTS